MAKRPSDVARILESELHRVLLIGAGQAGVVVAREITRRPDLGLHVVGFLDDDPLKVGTSIDGLRVLGTTEYVAAIAERKHITRALITIANAPGKQIRRITELCRDARLDTKIIPGIYEIVGDKVNLSRIREVAIEDLLGRAPISLDEERVREHPEPGRHGDRRRREHRSELCRQICRFGPGQARARRALRERAIRDPSRADVPRSPSADRAVHRRRSDVTAHGADLRRTAPSRAPRGRAQARADDGANPGEAVKNNVFGTRVVADLADRIGVERRS